MKKTPTEFTDEQLLALGCAVRTADWELRGTELWVITGPPERRVNSVTDGSLLSAIYEAAGFPGAVV